MSNKRQKLNEERLNTFFDTLKEELLDKQPGNPNQDYAVSRQLVRMRKRAAYTRPHLRVEAVQKFLDLNDSLESFSIDLDPLIVNNARHYIQVMAERYNTKVDPNNIQVSLDGNHLFDLWSYGPGASNGIEGTHVVEKITQKMLCTSSCVPFVRKLRSCSPYFDAFDRANASLGYDVVNGSRLTTVPKNEENERTIAIEPPGNMCMQLAAGKYLEGILRYIGLDIRTQQPLNKAMACRGSLDDSIATIDLKDASNMFLIQLVRLLMPHRWSDLLLALRSPEIELPDGKHVALRMISTMGNGFTFPLMTLLLTALIYGYRATRGGPTLFIDWTNTCVFGDDIIIPKHEYAGFTDVLRGAGLVVNHDKSFYNGPFRESCGGDYYNGYDVTPFYVKTLINDSGVYVAINQILEWSSKHSLLLSRSLLLLKSYLSSSPLLVPEWHNPDEGILTSQCPRRYKYLRAKVKRVKIRKDHPFLVPLAAGGYIESDHLDIVSLSKPRKTKTKVKATKYPKEYHAYFTPRPYFTEVKVKTARLPNGYLDGSYPIFRDRARTDYIGSYMFLFK